MSLLPVYNHEIEEPSVYIAPSKFGQGVFAMRTIPAGESILILAGPTITFDDAVAKGVQESYALQIGPATYIDTVAPGCYVNHSCDPNAGIVDGFELMALREIAEGAEILYDYSTTMQEDHWTMVCRCGTRACRRLVTDFALLPLALRQQYLRAGIVQPYIAAGTSLEVVRRFREPIRVPRLHSQLE
ncbi:MAG TPA: SET domain-containing protein [Thermoanaerobaculia bacterium]|nr:SET domain-containing protein [Thermoanaerobaculia bacterium]